MPTSPSDYIPRFATQLGLSGKVQAKAIEIIQKAKESGVLNGKGPTGIAAAALYVSSIHLGERKSQRDIAEIAGVTEVTIRNRYKELANNLGIAL
jgi:transcription initiation factor TFIIB